MTLSSTHLKNGYSAADMPAPNSTSQILLNWLKQNWQFVFTSLLVGGFIIMPASRTDLDTVRSSVSTLEHTVGELAKKTDDLSKTSIRLDERVTLLDKRMGTLEVRLDRMESKVDDHGQALARIEGKLDLIVPKAQAAATLSYLPPKKTWPAKQVPTSKPCTALGCIFSH